MTIGIGIPTYNRPDELLKCAWAVAEHAPEDALLFVSDDGSTDDKVTVVLHWLEQAGFTVLRGEHANVATSKNRLLRAMMDAGCDHLFLVEDDVAPKDGRAFKRYIRTAVRHDLHHLLFAHAGHRNRMVGASPALTWHYECVGAWAYYSRRAIETVGYMDEAFENCWEHVVHSMLIADAGLMPNAGWRRWPDVRYSEELIKDLGAESTHVTGTEDELMASERIQAGLRYWKSKYRFPADIEPLLKS